jgi:predicted DNA-binding helix-hairpin-helix protein
MAQKPKKNDGKKPYFYAGSSGMGVKPKDASKASKTAIKNWNALTPAQRNKVRRDLALNVALATAPYGRAAKVVGKGVKAAVNKRATNKFMKDLKKNGVAVKKPSSPFIGLTNSASARSERARAIRSGKVVDINKKRKGR